MILHYAACNQCGQQIEINEENTIVFQARVQTILLHKHNFNDNFFKEISFGSVKREMTAVRETSDTVSGSFCDKQCFVEYVTDKMQDNGLFKLTTEEIRESVDSFKYETQKE